MARPLDEILEEIKDVYFTMEDNPRMTPKEFIRQRMPFYLQGENNEDFFTFIEKIMRYEQKMEFWIWILKYQFSVLTAKGKFLDNLGRWLGLPRPPLPVKRTNQPVVIFPPTLESSGMTEQELIDFNSLHGITDYDGEGVKNTYFPSKDFIGETLVNDDEYRLYIISMLRLKQGLSFNTIIDIFTKILIKPFFITKHEADILEITASFYEDAVRLVIAREMTAKLRTTGFNVEVKQALEAEDEDITKKYGEDCWNQKNPYIEDEDN